MAIYTHPNNLTNCKLCVRRDTESSWKQQYQLKVTVKGFHSLLDAVKILASENNLNLADSTWLDTVLEQAKLPKGDCCPFVTNDRCE